MSQFLPEGFSQESKQETTAVPVRGPEQYLSPEERTFLQRMLSFPADLPSQFRSWMLDYIAVNGLEVPISQIRGYENAVQKIIDESMVQYKNEIETDIFTVLSGAVSKIAGQVTDIGQRWISLGGPSISGGPGIYLIWYGCEFRRSDYGYPTLYSISINGATPSDEDVISTTSDPYVTSSSIALKTLTETSNTIEAKYYGGWGLNNSTWQKRFVGALRIGKV